MHVRGEKDDGNDQSPDKHAQKRFKNSETEVNHQGKGSHLQDQINGNIDVVIIIRIGQFLITGHIHIFS